jgi:hypothetical protein
VTMMHRAGCEPIEGSRESQSLSSPKATPPRNPYLTKDFGSTESNILLHNLLMRWTLGAHGD